jgi:hypothetical protein
MGPNKLSTNPTGFYKLSRMLAKFALVTRDLVIPAPQLAGWLHAAEARGR